jgi:adenine-specific DNA methylase
VTATEIDDPESAKARGAFYTPRELTRFMAAWAIRTVDDSVLEPSCGDGAFISAANERFRMLGVSDISNRLIGVEREPGEARKAQRLSPSARIVTSDFFDVDPTTIGQVAAVLGNPPYVRYHGFAGADRAKAQGRASAMGVTLSRLASSWAAFVIHAAAFLADGGRLALVLPAELLHTDYGQPVREFLVRRFGSLVIVAFDQPVFGAQVDAVLLLASDDDARGLRVVRAPNEHALDELDVREYSHVAVKEPAHRWSRSLDPDAGALYATFESSEAALRLGAIASVDIGFVSGADSFFVVTAEQAESLALPTRILTPAIRRPGDIPGLLASRGDVRYLHDLAGSGDVTDPG